MILDLHLAEAHKGRFCTGMFHVHEDNTFHGIMTLHSSTCVHCGEQTLEPEHYIQILEHEITELVAVSIACGEDNKKWSLHGYNHAISFAIPRKHVDHTCPCGCEYEVTFA